MTAVRNVDVVVVPALAVPGSHREDCVVCGGSGRMRVAVVRQRGGVDRADRWPERGHCPLWTGVDGVLERIPAGAVGGDAA